MFTNSQGKNIDQEEPIFPLITYNPKKDVWKCVGTGFFIQAMGGFVTARHVFFDKQGQHLPTLYAVQTTSKGERHIRTLKHIVPHPNADIAVGFLGDRRTKGGKNIQPEIATPFTLSFEQLATGEKIRTYAFPLSEAENLETGESVLTFQGRWASGEVVDFHPEGAAMVRNRCYQTTMHIDHGASGGPVLKNNLVVGVNSSGWDVMEGEVPISFITPIDLILDLSVPEDGTMKPIKDLIERGMIAVK